MSSFFAAISFGALVDDLIPDLDAVRSVGSATKNWLQVHTKKVVSNVVDGATSVASVFDTVNALVTLGAKLASFRNAGVEKAAIDKDGKHAANGFDATNGVNSTGLFRALGTLALGYWAFDFDMPSGISGNGKVRLIDGGGGGGAPSFRVQNTSLLTAFLFEAINSAGFDFLTGRADTHSLRAKGIVSQTVPVFKVTLGATPGAGAKASRYEDSAGALLAEFSIAGALTQAEQATPAAPVSGSGTTYYKNVAGLTQYRVIFDDGTDVLIATSVA